MTIHELEFEIAFHGPFATATGNPDRGADVTVGATGLRGDAVDARGARPARDVDLAELLPATRLKGLMRAIAEHTLAVPGGVVEAVFGSPAVDSPWSWQAADLDDPWVLPRAQVALDPDAGTVVDGALLLAEEVWARGGRFRVLSHRPVADLATHELVLRSSAAGIHALGRSRRRGLGWVTVTPHPPLTPEDIGRLRQLGVPQ